MHETGTVRSLIHRVEDVARQYGESNVLSVHVRIGALSPMSKEHLREHFVQEARGTLLDHATLEIDEGTEITDPHAQYLTLLSIQCGDPCGEPASSR